MKAALPAILALGCLHPLPAPAQAVVPRSPEVHSFLSPMVLDYSLEQFLKSTSRFQTLDLAHYNCRGVSISRLSLAFVQETGRPPLLKTTSTLKNESGKDKRVSVTFDVRVGDTSLGSGKLPNLHVEVDQPVVKILSFPVKLSTTLTEETPQMRVTVELHDD